MLRFKKNYHKYKYMDFKKRPCNKKTGGLLKWLAIKAVYSQLRRS